MPYKNWSWENSLKDGHCKGTLNFAVAFLCNRKFRWNPLLHKKPYRTGSHTATQPRRWIMQAGYDNRIRDKSSAKRGIQIAGMIFQIRSSGEYFFLFADFSWKWVLLLKGSNLLKEPLSIFFQLVLSNSWYVQHFSFCFWKLVAHIHKSFVCKNDIRRNCFFLCNLQAKETELFKEICSFSGCLSGFSGRGSKALGTGRNGRFLFKFLYSDIHIFILKSLYIAQL